MKNVTLIETTSNKNKSWKLINNKGEEIPFFSIFSNLLIKKYSHNTRLSYCRNVALFIDCKDKEYRVTQEKLQTIKLFNLKLNNYYLDLVNLYEKDNKNKVKVEEIKFNILKALDENERKIYNEIS